MVHQFVSECVSTSTGDNGIFSVENKVTEHINVLAKLVTICPHNFALAISLCQKWEKNHQIGKKNGKK
jgi:hypothetical protein